MWECQEAPVHHCSFSHVSMEAKAMPVCCSSYSTFLWLVFSHSRILWFLCREQNGCVCLCCLHGVWDWLWFNCLANVLQVCSCYQTACDVYTLTPSLQQQKWSSFCWYMSQIKLNTLLLFTLIPKAALGYTNWFTINVWCFRAHLVWVCEWRKGEFVNMRNSCWIFLFMTCACLCMSRAFDRRKKTSLIYNEIKLCVYVSGVLSVWCCMCAGHRICCSPHSSLAGGLSALGVRQGISYFIETQHALDSIIESTWKAERSAVSTWLESAALRPSSSVHSLVLTITSWSRRYRCWQMSSQLTCYNIWKYFISIVHFRLKLS